MECGISEKGTHKGLDDKIMDHCRYKVYFCNEQKK